MGRGVFAFFGGELHWFELEVVGFFLGVWIRW